MVLLRRVIGDALRARRQGQHRTLREVSTAANVSLGYLSEIERGQKEASSELLAAICDALGARLSELLREVSSTLELAEGMQGVLVPVESGKAAAVAPVQATPVQPAAVQATPIQAAPVSPAPVTAAPADAAMRQVATDGTVSVSVHQETPLKATLRTTRKRDRDVIYAA
ncbi:helix-turn-helix domain-containing protein [Krasilnikovia sp. MM14-A1259]|uniref:helix-turn-helix domain-containing protein n=1 Tax=Krasilnikovia sp. MM14-A1259 TaxID=3373539 RepID=UPI0038068BBE